MGASIRIVRIQDALARFLQLYRAMTRLVKLATDHAPYDTSMPVFVVR